ncbi:MAG: hypothetical protein IRZ16_10660 [Myxococcaceae bacterium]|nr:hypothetical protein [Myxococcaceae bacterium]
MGSWRVDTSSWPIVVHSMEGTPGHEEIEAYIREATAVLYRREPHVVILDASRMGKVSAHLRARTRQWQTEHRDALRSWCLGTAKVLVSPLTRFIAMTVLMVNPLPTPWTVCESLDEARAWAADLLARVNRSASPTV